MQSLPQDGVKVQTSQPREGKKKERKERAIEQQPRKERAIETQLRKERAIELQPRKKRAANLTEEKKMVLRGLHNQGLTFSEIFIRRSALDPPMPTLTDAQIRRACGIRAESGETHPLKFTG